MDHQNFPPGTILFIINNSIEFYINLCAFTVHGVLILKEAAFEMQHVPSAAAHRTRKDLTLHRGVSLMKPIKDTDDMDPVSGQYI